MPLYVLGYFLSYIPYAALTKALSSGYLPGVGAHGGLVLLPAAAFGQLLAMPLFLWSSGWWRYGRRSMVGGRRLLQPDHKTLLAGLMTAVIIGTTTLNFTFPGVSILLMLVLMRSGTLALSPVVDRITGFRVHWYSWAAVSLSLLAGSLALADIRDYALPFGAVVSVGAYLAAYAGRFGIMGRVAKTGAKHADRRYLVGEHLSAPIFLVLLLGLGALAGQPDLRTGFTSFLASEGAWPAMGIGVLYECLFVFGTSIYLHRKEYSWAVPINRASSLISGVAAAALLAALVPDAANGLPGRGQQLALVAVLGAVVMVSFPSIKQRLQGAGSPQPRLLLFVCGGNTCRSPMAEAIALEELAIARAGHLFRVASAGVTVRTVGAPMTPDAIVALGEMGIEVRHRTRALTAELCRSADVIYCMTASQLESILALAPDVAGRTFCLDPVGDIPDPIGQPLAVYRDFAEKLRLLIRQRLAELAGS